MTRQPGWWERAGRVIDEAWADLVLIVREVFDVPVIRDPEAMPEPDSEPTTGAPEVEPCPDCRQEPRRPKGHSGAHRTKP
jgi:hypothetical protein